MVIPLNCITPGETVRIVWLGNDNRMAGRLHDLGFEIGAAISCILQRPKKNIAAYLVRNAVIALRETDSRLILTEPLAETKRANGCSVPQSKKNFLSQELSS